MTKSQIAKLGKFRLTARADAPDFRDYPYCPALINLKPRLEVPSDLRAASPIRI